LHCDAADLRQIQRNPRLNPARIFAADAIGRSRRFCRGRSLNGLTASSMSGLWPAESGKSKWEIEDYA
jgi:hypothetical protein